VTGEEDSVRDRLEALFRSERTALLATLVRRCGGDFDLAEDALSEAVAVALERWTDGGVPANPAGWILTTARRRAIDRIRRADTFRRKKPLLEALSREPEPPPSLPAEDDVIDDDRLRLVFACCHPALSTEAQIALTLRAVAGLTTREIARAFLIADTTMAQRLVRAKRKVKDAGIPFRVPPPEQRDARQSAVLTVLYLIFNEGYASTSGEPLVRADLCREAIRLGRLVHALMPSDREVAGLLALMLLHDARRAARTDASGNLVLLEDQDRAQWDTEGISEGVALLDFALGGGRDEPPGPYALQAAITALHCEAPTPEETDWRQIAALYGELERIAGGPVIGLNRAVAVAMAHEPEDGLALLEPLADPLERYHPFHAARADLLRRAGRGSEALRAYDAAIALCSQPVERRCLERGRDALR